MMIAMEYSRQHVIDLLRSSGGQTSPTRRREFYPIRLMSTGSWHWGDKRLIPFRWRPTRSGRA